MKKVFMFASAAIAALAMVSCNKEIEIQDQIAEGICPDGYYIEELEATYPVDPATRTAFNETTGKFAWTEGDELAFHLSNGTYTSAPIDPATSKVKLYLPVGVTRDNYAVYPASAVVDEAAEVGNMQVTLPSTYDISDNLTTEFVPMPLIATNDAENKNLKFEHVGALLQVNLNVPAGVKTAKLSMGKTITGTFDLAAGSGNGVIEAGAASDDALTFVLSEEGLADATTVKLLAPLPSGTYEKFEVAYDNGFVFTKDLSSSPWNFDRTQGKKVSIAEENFEDPNDYFWFEALEAGSTVKFSSLPDSDAKQVFYSYDKRNWTRLDSSTVLELEEIGDRCYFYHEGETALGVKYGNDNDHIYVGKIIEGTGKLKCGGELRFMFQKGKANFSDHAFVGMFYQMTSLIDASELVFPEYTAYYCYRSMFAGCSSLTAPPDLPAETMSTGCYSAMFSGATSLSYAPELPAMELASECYSDMFNGCTFAIPPILPATTMKAYCYNKMFYSSGITQLPELPATVLASYCYWNMFAYCKGLTDIDDFVLPAVTLKNRCYMSMFEGCSKLSSARISMLADEMAENSCYKMFSGCSVLVHGPALPATIMAKNCYNNMFQQCYKLEDTICLPALTLAENCYNSMFYYCKTLPEVEIMATDVSATDCLYQMFRACTSLTTIKVHFTEWPSSLSRWIEGYNSDRLPSSGEFYKPSSLENIVGTITDTVYPVYSYIPKGWTVYNLEEVGAGI